MHPWLWVPRAGESAPGREAIGGKAAALAALAAVRGPGGVAPEVPGFVVLRAEAFASAAAGLSADAAARRAALLAWAPPAALRFGLIAAMLQADLAAGSVAVRSSAAAEDGAEASFAGQYESVLGVPGADEAALWDAIRRVWASTTSAHAVAYGAARGGAGPAMAVLLQRMAEPLAAGVAFGADPVTGDRETVVVSAVWGLGEALVSGEADADTFRLAREGGAWRVRERTVAAKTHAAVIRAGALVRELLATERAQAPALTDAQAGEVAAWTREVSDAFGAPQDVEWALAGEPPRVVLLQARAITTLPVHASGSTSPGRASGTPSRGSGPSAVGAGATADPGAPAGLAAERRVWDNSNIVESYAGVTTPLTFTFARTVYEDVYRQFCRVMGVPESLVAAHAPVFANMLGLVRGRVYYQLLNWYRTLALLPGFAFNRGFMERMMGVRERLEDPPPPPGSGDRVRDLVRLVAMVVRMTRASAGLKHDVPAFHRRVDAVLAMYDDRLFASSRPRDLGEHWFRLKGALLEQWREPLVNDFFAMLFFGVLCRLIERWLPDAPPTLANDLLCGEGGIVSTEPARAVMGMARLAAADPALRAALEAERPLAELRACGAAGAEFAARWDAYVVRFGDRCMNELKLETVTLREDPSFLYAMVHAYVAQGAPDPDAALAREREIRAAAERRVRGTLGWPKRPVFDFVLAQARARVRDRENLRFERTRVFGLLRRLFLALGARWAEAGVLTEPRDVFWLTLDEVLRASVGSPPADGFAARIAARRARFAAWERGPAPPDRFETAGGVADWLAHDPPEIATAAAPAAVAGELRGLGCCPGVVRGRVRVVHDPAQARDLAGRILVAERTDPGWTLLFPAVAGLLVQRGSLLSHSAIVAREMGIPCVVGVPGLLGALRDGDEVEMDGTTGTIRQLAAGEDA